MIARCTTSLEPRSARKYSNLEVVRLQNEPTTGRARKLFYVGWQPEVIAILPVQPFPSLWPILYKPEHKKCPGKGTVQPNGCQASLNSRILSALPLSASPKPPNRNGLVVSREWRFEVPNYRKRGTLITPQPQPLRKYVVAVPDFFFLPPLP